MKNALVGQSGGPTAAINASLAGVIKACADSSAIDKIYGMVNGIEGFLKESLLDLSENAKDDSFIDLLSKTPASYLGSCRYKLPKDDMAVFDKIFEILDKYNIGYFFYIGGNDSMDTVLKLSKIAKEKGSDIKFVGVPKTIDNDLPITDHTPGYGSAAKYIATTVREISLDSLVYEAKSVTIVEIMGRDAGWLTAAAALGRGDGLGPDLIYLPEVAFSFDGFIDDLKEVLKYKNNVIVAVSEGVRTGVGKYVCEAASSGGKDVFGHTQLGGTARVLENFVRSTLKIKARGVELNVCQRAAGHILSKTDIEESFAAGSGAVSLALSGKTGVMAIIERVSDAPYETKISEGDIEKIANLVKSVPENYINKAGNDVTDEFVAYASPLILGEVALAYENGVPKAAVRKR